MTDIDAYLDNERKSHLDYQAQKQLRFELRVVDKLLHGLEAAPGVANGLKVEAGGDLTMRWLMDRFDLFPIKLGTFKAPKTILFTEFIQGPTKFKVWNAFEEVMANYGDSDPAGLVFASEGDGMPEMVLHNWHDAPASDMWSVLLPCVGEDAYGTAFILDPFKGLLERIRITDWTFRNIG